MTRNEIKAKLTQSRESAQDILALLDTGAPVRDPEGALRNLASGIVGMSQQVAAHLDGLEQKQAVAIAVTEAGWNVRIQNLEAELIELRKIGYSGVARPANGERAR